MVTIKVNVEYTVNKEYAINVEADSYDEAMTKADNIVERKIKAGDFNFVKGIDGIVTNCCYCLEDSDFVDCN